MKQLPTLLQPWHPWLSLFPPDLVEPLGALLLRLHPQIGPLRSAPARADAMPEGVGSIVQRGPYERLLISEWAYADAEPDEFIRRAASGELMFTGPEPAARQRSRRCLALFDTGPAQLGEPRLLHLALFILLARRAEEAGAQFEWGVLHAPDVLHNTSAREAILALLKARTLVAAEPEQIGAWEKVIDMTGDDAWVIGANGIKPPAGVRGQIAISRQMLAERLDVKLTMHQSVRQFALDLPAPELAIRLLRSPFEALAAASLAGVRQKSGRPSLLLAPRFSVGAALLAVPQLDGGIMLYPVPNSLRATPGKPRSQPAQSKSTILGGGVFNKSMGCLLSEGNSLRFRGFPSEGFASKYATVPRPPPEKFRAPPQSGRWLPVFFLKADLAVARNAPRNVRSNVIVLDQGGNLVCWSRDASHQSGTVTNASIEFRTLASNVIGAEQTIGWLVFGLSVGAETQLHSFAPNSGVSLIAVLPFAGERMLFGDLRHWTRTKAYGLLALQINATDWWTGTSAEMTMLSVTAGARVIGVARSRKHGTVGLVVLAPGRRIIELYSRSGVRVLVRSSSDIAQASVCPYTGNIAWVGARTLRVYVQGIDEDKPYLQVLTAEGDNDE